ncbi:MAG: hypothetical protein WD845_14120 [Pirellulales bacterium]
MAFSRRSPARRGTRPHRRPRLRFEALEDRRLLSVVPDGPEFLVNTFTTDGQYNPSVATDVDGDFVVAWQSFGQEHLSGIYAQRYNAGGVALGSEFQVNTTETDQQLDPSVAMDADGDFVVVWTSEPFLAAGQDGDGDGVYAQRYNAAGVAQGSEFRVNTYTIGDQNDATVAMDADGDFVVVWTSVAQENGFDVYAQRYNAAGMPQ